MLVRISPGNTDHLSVGLVIKIGPKGSRFDRKDQNGHKHPREVATTRERPDQPDVKHGKPM